MSAAGEVRAAVPLPVAGFTLLEALVVLAVLALIAGIGFPRVDAAMRRFAAHEAAARVGRALHAARAAAFRRDMPVRFMILDEGRGFAVLDERDRVPADLRAEASSGSILFFPDGTSAGGTVGLNGTGGRWRWHVHPTTGMIEDAR